MKKAACCFLIAFLFLPGAVRAQSIHSFDIRLSQYTYPFPVHFITILAQGDTLQMAYMDVKPGNPNGKTVLLLHGKNFCGAYWGKTAEDLVHAGYEVVIPDQIGFGKSSKPAFLQYSFQWLAENTRQLLDTLHLDTVDVLGHSMGGMLAARFTLMFPARVSRLILEDPIGLEDWKLKVPYSSVDQWYQSELHMTYATLKKYEQTSYYHGEWKPAYDPWLDLAASWLSDSAYPRVAWNSALLYDMIFTQPVLYEFPHIRVPTLVIVGTLDRTAMGKDKVPESVARTMGDYPELGRKTRDAIPGARLIEIEGVGHIPHVEAYDQFLAPVLSFLKM